MLDARKDVGGRSLLIACSVILSLVSDRAATAQVPGWQPMPSVNDFARSAPRIVNGVLTSDYPSTGALLFGTKPENAGLQCSGTLIGCQTFLTAAHCVCDADGALCQTFYAPDPRNFLVFLQHGGLFEVQSIAVHPDFGFPVGDVAVLRLKKPVEGIAPSAINDFAPAPFGTPGTIVGFGRAGGNFFDYGIKRSGAVTTSACESGISDQTSVCWRFDSPIGPPGVDSNTCNGDSGGPLFLDVGGGISVGGTTSGGRFDCLPPDLSFDANVFNYSGYIAAQSGNDLGGSSCGCLANAGSASAPIFAASGRLSEAGPDGRHLVVVPAGTKRLRIAMNAEDYFGSNDFDLFVKRGNPPTASLFDCRQNGPGQFAACEFDDPAAGNWYVLVRRFSGQGRYQVTATAFGAAPGAEGQSCDDGNPCTIDDQCTDGSCAGGALSGVSCDDGDGCTSNDHCVDGVCLADAVTCTDQSDQCQDTTVCHPTLGCTSPPKPDFTPCDAGDGVVCSFGAQCFLGVCDSQPDDDGDKICSFDDNCALVANPDQVDIDHDGSGNVCDPLDGPLRIQRLKLIGRSSTSALNGKISLRAEFTTSLPDTFDPTRGVAVAVTDELNLSRSFTWGPGKCETSMTGTTTCTKRDRDVTVQIRRLRSTTPGAATYVVNFRATGLRIATPFVPPVRVTLTDGPGKIVTGTDRGGRTGNCTSSNPGLTCASPYANPLRAFLGGATQSLLD